MKLSVMTLGCPGWDLATILTRAKEYGYAGVDFRGVAEEIDITKLPAFTSGIAATKRQIAEAGLAVSGISTSISACDSERRTSNLEEARRTIPVALELGTKNLRIFGGGPVEKIGHAAAAEIGRECIEQILALPGADKLHWNFETHDHWIKSVDCKRLLDTIGHPAFGVTWDMGHTARVGEETPEHTYSALGHRVHYAHVKDAVFEPKHPQAMTDGWRYVLPGEGQLPLSHAVRLLRSHGYQGWILFEHEKRWHPNLPEPEVAFPAFIKWARNVLAA